MKLAELHQLINEESTLNDYSVERDQPVEDPGDGETLPEEEEGGDGEEESGVQRLVNIFREIAQSPNIEEIVRNYIQNVDDPDQIADELEQAYTSVGANDGMVANPDDHAEGREGQFWNRVGV